MQTYTVKQVAEILGYSTNSIYTFLKEKRIKGVRVGKGRFRISQEELDRLLHLAKKTVSNVPLPLAQPASSNGETIPATPAVSEMTGNLSNPDAENAFAAHQLNQTFKLESPSLFDWFIGVASILLGASMFLLNSYGQDYAISKYAIWMLPLRVSLIIAGIGILGIDILGKSKSAWSFFFHGLLVVLYALFSSLLFQSGDFDGFTIFGLAAAVQIVSLSIGMGNVTSFAMYTSLTLLFVPLSLFFKSPPSQLPAIFSGLDKTDPVLISVWMGIGLVFILLMWWSYYRKRIFFYLIICLATFALVTLAVWYASVILWGRAFFLLIMAVSTIIAPLWNRMKIAKPRDRMIIFAGHAIMLFIFLSAITVVRLIQINTLSYVKGQMLNKVEYGKVLIESAFGNMTQSLESSATNPTLIAAVQKNQKDLASGIARNIYEGNRNFRRVLILNQFGELIAIYPTLTLDTTNFSSGIYFTEVAKSKKTYISDLLPTAASDNTNTVVLSTPIGSQATFSGVLVGSADLDYLGIRLQQITDPTKQEYFTVADTSGKRILHPDPKMVNSELDRDDSIRSAFLGTKGVSQYNAPQEAFVEAYDLIEKLGWAIGVVQPLVSALAFTNSTSFIVFYVMMASLGVLVSVVWLRTRIRSGPGKDT